MKKNYNNYLSTRFYQGMIKLSLLIVMLLLVTTTTFAQNGKTVRVSNNIELTQMVYNSDVQVITLEPGYYDLLKMEVFPDEVVKIFLEEGERSPNAECIYYIQTRTTCWIDGTTPLLLEAGMIAGDNCATLDDGDWDKISGPGTETYSQPQNVQVQNVTVNAPGVYGFKYTWANTRYVNGDYLWHDTPEIDLPDTYDVCGLESQFVTVYNVAIGAALQTSTWTTTPGTATVTLVGTTTSTLGGEIYYTKTWDIDVAACGTYSLTYTVENGPCTNSADFSIDFFDTPTNVNAGADGEFCGLTGTLNASYDASCELGGAATQTWNWVGPVGATTPTFGSNTGGAQEWAGTVTVTQCGIYTFTYNVDNGPCPVQTDAVVIEFFDSPTPVNAGTDAAFCGLVGSLSASYDASCELGGAATQTWTYVGPGTAAYGTNTGAAQEWIGTITVTTCGTYTFTYHVDNGPCGIVTDDVVINFYDTPTLVEAAAVNAEICGTEAIGGVTTTYTVGCAQGIVSDTWTYEAPATRTATITRNMDKASTDSWDVNVSGCGVYTFTYSVDNGLCEPVTDIVVINFFETPVVTIAPVPDVCGLVATLTPTVTVGCDPGDMVTAWTKTGGPGTATATFSGNEVTVSECGTYTFTYSVTNAPCPLVSSTVVVDFFDTPVLTTPAPFAVCGYSTPFIVSATANCALGTVTETVTTTGKPVGAGEPVIVFIGQGIAAKAPPSNSILVDKCGIYTFTYTVDSGPCTETEDFVVTFYEQPDFDVIGTVSPTLCKEYTYEIDDLRLCNFGSVTYTWDITGGYIDDGGTIVTWIETVDTETITVVWTDEIVGTLSVTSESIEGLCTVTGTFNFDAQYPAIAGQVKYWNSEETYMPTPFPTIENASYPHDYFYVTLHNSLNDVAIDTLIVEPYLDEVQTGTNTWTTIDLMSFFGVDLGDIYTSTFTIFKTFGCEGYYLKVWDGGLVYHQNPSTYDEVLGANYTYNNWGGVNATDALAIQLMATNININAAPYNFGWVGPNTDVPRFGYYSSSAANVNSSLQANPITALDALTTNYRAVGLMDVFPYLTTNSGRYSPNFRVTGRMVSTLPEMTWNTPFDLDNVPDVVFAHNDSVYNNYLYYDLATNHQYVSEPLSLLNTSYINIYYLAAGDINSSYIPTSAGFNKSTPAINLEYTDELIVNKGEVVTIPVRVDRNAELGAITLDLTYNASLIEVLNVNYDKENFKVDAEKGTLRIGWFSEVPANFASGDAIAMIQVRVLADINTDTRFFELGANTDLADANAQSLKDIKLQTSAINTLDAGLFVTNYPNPFNGKTTISYHLPSDSKVSLVVYNTMSQVIETLVSSYQEAGTHQVEFGSTDLKAGVYYYRIVVESEGKSVVETNSMIHMQ